MDTLLKIFKSLGVDESFFVQFAIVVSLYWLLKTLLFSKLQFVLELRESKTTKREDEANKKFQQADNLALKYKETIEKVQQEAHLVVTSKREESEKKMRDQIKEKSKQLEKELEEKRSAAQNEIDSKRTSVLAQADALANELIQKLTK